MNFDGGGSSAMYVQGLGVVNHPSDGADTDAGIDDPGTEPPDEETPTDPLMQGGCATAPGPTVLAALAFLATRRRS
jgi:hypothetical protein